MGCFRTLVLDLLILWSPEQVVFFGRFSQNHSLLVGQNHPPPLNPWLVVSILLKHMKVSWDDSSQYGKIIKGSKPPTSQCLLSLLTKHPISSYSVESLMLGHSHIHFRQLFGRVYVSWTLKSWSFYPCFYWVIYTFLCGSFDCLKKKNSSILMLNPCLLPKNMILYIDLLPNYL
jgi:hypothetical protein